MAMAAFSLAPFRFLLLRNGCTRAPCWIPIGLSISAEILHACTNRAFCYRKPKACNVRSTRKTPKKHTQVAVYARELILSTGLQQRHFHGEAHSSLGDVFYALSTFCSFSIAARFALVGVPAYEILVPTAARAFTPADSSVVLLPSYHALLPRLPTRTRVSACFARALEQ